MKGKKLVSIVMPCHNEEKNIKQMYKEISRVVSSESLASHQFQVMFVDDGSSDGTWDEIAAIAEGSNMVSALRFSRNFGHQAALEAGMKAASGDAVITLDADLQHPPKIIPALIAKWEQGYEIVNTKRIDSRGAPFLKRVSSRMYYRLINMISRVHIEEGSADFRLLSRKVLDQLNSMTEKNKFYRGLVNWVGYRKCTLSYQARERLEGKSSYSLRKMLELARIGITSFTYLPMKIILVLGALLVLFSLLVIAASAAFFAGDSAVFFTLLILGFIMLNNGIIVLILGVIAVYQINMYDELQNRPNYIIRDRLNIY